MTAPAEPIAPVDDGEDETAPDELTQEIVAKSQVFPSSDPPEKTFACSKCGTPVEEQYQLVGGKCGPCNTLADSSSMIPPNTTNTRTIINAVNTLGKIVAKSIGQDAFDALSAEVSDG